MDINITDSQLYKRIIDEKNIFAAIYSIESYIFDKGLLDTEMPVVYSDNNGKSCETIANNDLELFYILADKHNVEFIKKVIQICKQRLIWLFSKKENIFTVQVYFKLKSYDNAGLKFRPLHTARLTDLICMVSILSCLMFEDDYEKGKRKLSDLSKLIPHNFYGNIPCTDVQYLFHKWQTKYKEYTENVVEHCRAYQKNHNYLTEICLDIKNFFPSISPLLLYNYIVDKLCSSTPSEDKFALKLAVTKLLYFKVEKDNVESWKDYYYSELLKTKDNGIYMTCGIPQGLPQSYFFGNLCMIEIKKRLMEKDIFYGDAYFYVDDSVIYIQSEMNATRFSETIQKLNKKIENWCIETQEGDIADYVSEQYLKFHRDLKYIIAFHEEGKSVFNQIDNADNRFGLISQLARETSMTSMLSWNLDEIDDHITLEKLEALNELVSKEIDELKQRMADDSKPNLNNRESSHLKLLKRYKKYFLYRYRLLKIRDEGGPKETMFEDFKKRFLCITNTQNVEDWFNKEDEDIFMSEYRLLIQKWPKNKAEEFLDYIMRFESNMLTYGVKINNSTLNERYLYFSKDAQAAVKMKRISRDIYKSLIRWARENYSGLQYLKQDNQINEFRLFLIDHHFDKKDQYRVEGGQLESSRSYSSIYSMMETGFEQEDFTSFVLKSSSEFQRRILNVYFSEIMGILPSDAINFTKSNSRKLHYSELRILAYLRNKEFNLEQFEEFIEHLDEKDVSNQMAIDMALLEVLGRFISHVRKPDWIDSLILTHRITKGLWYNGSKFLNSYTLHNEEHAVTLINKSLELTNRIDYFVLKNVDYYILFLACYLHDISMVIHPDLGRLSSNQGKNLATISKLMIRMKKEVDDFSKADPKDRKNSRMKDAGKFLIDIFKEVYEYFESEVRDNHAKDSADFIRGKSNSLLGYLTPTLRSFVAKVSESHGYDVYDVYGLKSRAKDDTVSIKYLMILIRLADLLDVANDRVNYHLLRQNLNHLSSTSRFHWISHLVTDKIELVTNYKLKNNPSAKERPIEEVIDFNLYLNFKQLTTTQKKGKCKSCQCDMCDNHISLKIKSAHAPIEECKQDSCTILCRWMMKKHEWLVSELVALHDYLFSVNNSVFDTNINFKIFYGDKKLDPDMFDNVQEYLKE